MRKHSIKVGGGIILIPTEREGMTCPFDLYVTGKYGQEFVGTALHYHPSVRHRPAGHRWGVCDWTEMVGGGPGEGAAHGRCYPFKTFAAMAIFLLEKWGIKEGAK